jgi:hypothetical protein
MNTDIRVHTLRGTLSVYTFKSDQIFWFEYLFADAGSTKFLGDTMPYSLSQFCPSKSYRFIEKRTIVAYPKMVNE